MKQSVPKPPPGDRPLKTLERVLSKAGLGSRTEARSWIGGGRVRSTARSCAIPMRGSTWSATASPSTASRCGAKSASYLLLHKPAGYITTYRDPQGRPTIYDLLPDRERYLFPVGRLDLDTSGLLILTNDTAVRRAADESRVSRAEDVSASTPTGRSPTQISTLFAAASSCATARRGPRA